MPRMNNSATVTSIIKERLGYVAGALFLSLLLLCVGACGTGCTAKDAAPSQTARVALSDIPAYSGFPYVEINDNVPDFAEEELTTKAYEEYFPLDNLGRATGAQACVGTELMPTEERESICDVKPTGWHSVQYDFIENGGSLYNRSHLIAFQLTGENANPENLITGTRYMNASTMVPFEEEVGDYVRKTRNHVLYRVTPLYEGDNLVASGVHMEARSVEDNGRGVSFNIYAYNVQPGVTIDYATGDNRADGTVGASSGSAALDASQYRYILNSGGMKIHRADCTGVANIKERNKVGYNGTVEEAEAMGYTPCGLCNP